MANLATFSFGSNSVRSFADEKNELHFNANDICDILGYANPRRTVSLHCKEQGCTKLVHRVSSGKKANGQDALQDVEMTYINEPNLYRLIIKSKKPEAEAFEIWVMEEVLPSIRKTGSYTLTITPAQQRGIQEAVNAAVHRQHGRTHQGMYSAIKTKFGIAKYDQLPATQYDECIEWLGDGMVTKTQPKALELTEDIRAMLYSVCYEALNANHDSGRLLIALKVFDEKTALYKLRSIIESNNSIMQLAHKLGLRNKNKDPLIAENGFLSFDNGGGYRLDSRLFAV